MLDMGFLPDIRRVLRHLPSQAADAVLQRDDAGADRRAHARDAATIRSTINLERQAAPAVGITQAVYPVPQDLKAGAARRRCSSAASMRDALVFTRTKHRANRLAKHLVQAGRQGRAHPRQPVAGAAHRGAGRLQERQVPGARRDRHRGARHRRHGARPRRQLRRAAGARRLHPPRRPHGARRGDRRRRSRSSSPEEEDDLRGDRARDRQAAAARHGARLRLHGARGGELEVPLAERIAAIRARKAEERARAGQGRAPRGGRGQPLEHATSRRTAGQPRIRQPAPEQSERNPLGRPPTPLPIAPEP